MDDVLRTAVDQIGSVFDAEVAILLTKGDQLERQPHAASTLTVDEKDFAVAAWVFENGKRAGRFTETLPEAVGQYLPLRTPSRTVGRDRHPHAPGRHAHRSTRRCCWKPSPARWRW